MTDVLLDARMAIRGLGISTYVERLVSGLEGQPGARVTLWGGTGGWDRGGRLSTITRSGLFDVSPRLDPRTAGFDVVHYASNIGSVLPGPRSVLTVYDLMHRRHRRGRDRLTGFLLEASMRRAGRIVAISERTRAEIRRTFPALSHRVELVPPGMRRLARPGGERRHLLGFGGASDPRKRTDLLVDVYDEYRATTPDPLPLVVLARAGLTEAQDRRLRALDARIVLDASRDAVDGLVGSAAAVVYPTTTEGLGFPILEAAELGTPVVIDAAADVAAEVVGSHCFRVEGSSPRDWAIVVRRAAASAPVYDAVELGDWTEVAARYAELYEAVRAA